MTRYEIAERLELLVSSVCGLVRPMVKSGTLIESGATRPSPNGHASKVLRLPQFVEAN